MKSIRVFALGLGALFACTGAPNEAERLADSFRDAARIYRVPQPLLEGIGYTETRWVHRPGRPALDNGFGLMHLADWGDNSPLGRAARLTGLSPERLRTDPDANIRGAAALLRAEADRYFRDTPALDEGDLGAWWQVVMRYSNADDPKIADSYATSVYVAVVRGAEGLLSDGSAYRLAPRTVDVSAQKLFGRMEQALGMDYPPSIWVRSPNFSQGRSGAAPKYVVVHTTQGSYAGSISWLKNPQSSASAHYVVRSSDGEITQMVRDADTGWHAGNWDYNTQSVGIEHEGFVDQPSYLTQALYQSSANLTRWLCDTYGIPKDRAHLIGHNEIPHPTIAGRFGGKNGHTDPCITVDGTQCFWNWAHYLSLVRGETTQTGILRGTVYSSEGGCHYTPSGLEGCTIPVAGARVFVPETGDTVLASGSGQFVLTLAPGNYTPSASAAGFHDSTPLLGATRTVDAGQTTWSSFILEKNASTGTLEGFVYEVNPSDESDRSLRLGGATVAVGTNVVSADANGAFHLVVSAGSVEVTASRQGWQSATRTAEVQADGTTTLEIGLLPSVEDEQEPAEGTKNLVGLVLDVATGAPVPEARVTSGEAFSVSDDDGRYALALPAGQASVAVQADGYLSRAATVFVSAEGTTRDLFVAPEDAGPLVVITSPKSGSRLVRTSVRVTGTAATPLLFRVQVNGVPAEVKDGAFEALVPIEAGRNVITALATTADGLEATAQVQVTGEEEESGCGCASGADTLLAAAGLLLLRRTRRT